MSSGYLVINCYRYRFCSKTHKMH